MKSLITLLLVASAVSISAQTIKNTKHDLSTTSTTTGPKTDTTQMCVFCHTPHGSAIGAAAQLAPLWNRKAGAATPTFTMYSSATLNGAMDSSPTGASMACFTCHDGTQAVGDLINMPNDKATFAYSGANQTSGMLTGGNALLGRDLSNDHPIGVTYDSAVANSGLVAIASLPTTVRLFSNKVQCASCHDVHNNANGSFLRVTMAGSALCTTCHTK